MSDESALVAVEERTVIFYDDEWTAVLVQVGDEEQVFVPVRPLCELPGGGGAVLSGAAAGRRPIQNDLV